MASMLGLLEAREASARERVEALREEAARVAAALEAGEIELDRRVIAREELVDALAAAAAETTAAEPVLAPPAEEGVDPAPGGEVRGHRPPGDPARDQVADRVEYLAVGLGLPTPPLKPGRHRQQADGRRDQAA